MKKALEVSKIAGCMMHSLRFIVDWGVGEIVPAFFYSNSI